MAIESIHDCDERYVVRSYERSRRRCAEGCPIKQVVCGPHSMVGLLGRSALNGLDGVELGLAGLGWAGLG